MLRKAVGLAVTFSSI